MSATPEPLVLVIEDEPQMLRFLRPALTGHGYRVVEATSGEEGLRQAATRAPDVVILDLGLPDLDGLEVARRLREWSRVPIRSTQRRSGPAIRSWRISTSFSRSMTTRVEDSPLQKRRL